MRRKSKKKKDDNRSLMRKIFASKTEDRRSDCQAQNFENYRTASNNSLFSRKTVH